jgi:hypothetical protein
MWQHKTNLTKMNTKLFKIFFKDLIFTSYQLILAKKIPLGGVPCVDMDTHHHWCRLWGHQSCWVTKPLV